MDEFIGDILWGLIFLAIVGWLISELLRVLH